MDADLESIAEARRRALSAYDAWQKFRSFAAEEVDRVVEAMARAVAGHAARLGQMAAEETGYGNAEDKRIKNLFNTIAVSDWLRGVRTLGVLWRDETTKVLAIGEPMGVVAALIPVTNPTSTVIFKSLSAVKAGNAVVHAPHPRGRESSAETVRILAEAAVAAGAPEGLIQCLSAPTIEGTQALMRHHRVAVVMATGGAAMVRAAYSCGKPTLAVGPGNVPVYVHRSVAPDLAEVAEMVVSSKSFDYGTACVSEQALVVDRAVAGQFRHALREAGAYFCTTREASALGEVIFGADLSLRPQHVGQSPERLARLAGFEVPVRTRVIIAEPGRVGREAPLSAEKLNPVLAFYEVADERDGHAVCAAVLRFGGEGHTVGVHAHDPDIVSAFAGLPAGRVVVNTPCLHGGMGFSADLDPSFMLGTGTLSGSITSDNVTALHLINIKRVAYESRPWRSLAEYVEGGSRT